MPASVEPNTGTLQKDIETQQSVENNLKDIILFFSFVCLVITLLGVYSAITLDTERRQKEEVEVGSVSDIITYKKNPDEASLIIVNKTASTNNAAQIYIIEQ